MEQGTATRQGIKGAADRLRLRAASWRQRALWSLTHLWESLRDCLERELAQRIGFQWLAVCFAVGSLIYFLLPREPVAPVLFAACLSASAIATISYRRGTAWRLFAVAAVCLAGASAAKLRVDSLSGPHIEQSRTATISGRVVHLDNRAERRPRIVLDSLRSDPARPGELPRRIRVTIGSQQDMPPLGARIALLARLGPVAEPAVPGGYDPRRAAFFEGIGGSGFALGGWTLEEEAEHASPALFVAQVRATIVARIMAAQPGEAGAVAAALLVGERAGLSQETNESLRISGLAHILSISGLHMMLIAGTAFFATRALLALSPTLALGQPIRKWAALIALAVVTIYLALSGGGPATLRAYVMAAIMFLAILLDRPAISMRNLAIAAFVVLALEPEGVTEPGFQMSFAAVTALVAGWEGWHGRERLRLADETALPGLAALRYFGRALIGVALTSLVAGLATAPFAAYHFERVATYSLLGNVATAPLVSLVIMPFGLLTLVMTPLGLEQFPLAAMAMGIEALLQVSDWVAGLPGADASAPPMSPVSLTLIAAGMLWLCLWRERWRLAGVPVICFGLAMIPLTGSRADILIAPDGKVVAVRDPTGTLRVSGGSAGSYVIEQVFEDEPGPAPDLAALRKGIGCDGTGCVLAGPWQIQVAHVLAAEAFAEDCSRSDVVVTGLSAPPDCVAPLLIDRDELRKFGAHSLRFDENEGRFQANTERSSFPRPWQAQASRP